MSPTISYSKKITLILVILLILFSSLPLLAQNVAEARLVILNPMAMIEQSDLIIAGNVKDLVTGEAERKVTIKIDSVLKGEYAETDLTLEIRPSRYGWNEFPPEGTKVMLLLSKEEDGSYNLTADLNNIAVIDKNDEVKIPTNRGGMDSWTPDSYERFYTLFFKENYNKPNNQLSQVSNMSTNKFAADKLLYQSINIVILVLLLAFGFWVFFGCRRRGLSYFNSVLWSLVVVFIIPPIGILIYFFYRRKRWI